MDAGLARTTMIREREIKLEHELSIDMGIYARQDSLASPWFSSPEFSARGLLVRCLFDEWQYTSNYLPNFWFRKSAKIETVCEKDLSLLNKVSGIYEKSDIIEGCLSGTAKVHFAVPDTDYKTQTRSESYATPRKHFSTPATAQVSLQGITVGRKDAASKWAKEGKQLVLTIEVTLQLLEVSSSPSLSLQILACPAQLSASDTLQKMLSERLHPDVQLQLQDGVLPAHRAVLAACSPVFRGMFAHDMKERRSGQVDLRDVPLAAMQTTLKLLYGGKLSSRDPELWMQVLQLADRFQLALLKVLCESTLCARVSALPSELLLRLLVLADQHNVPDLRSAILSRLSTCMRGKELGSDALDLVKDYPTVAKDLIEFFLR